MRTSPAAPNGHDASNTDIASMPPYNFIMGSLSNGGGRRAAGLSEPASWKLAATGLLFDNTSPPALRADKRHDAVLHFPRDSPQRAHYTPTHQHHSFARKSP